MLAAECENQHLHSFSIKRHATQLPRLKAQLLCHQSRFITLSACTWEASISHCHVARERRLN